MRQLCFSSKALLQLAMIAVGVFSQSSARADDYKYGMAGCGVGSIVFGSGGSQVSAATTNGTFGSPFAITSGTSNCTPTNETWVAQENFVTSNLATLSKDVAQGSGDTLVVLQKLMDCQPNADQNFRATLQGAYSKIFSEPGALAVLDAIKGEINAKPDLKAQCNAI